MKRSINEILKLTTNRKEYHVLRCVDQDPYSEDYGQYFARKPGNRGYKKSMRIWKWQIRMYRTWKHNRKTKWKE